MVDLGSGSNLFATMTTIVGSGSKDIHFDDHWMIENLGSGSKNIGSNEDEYFGQKHGEVREESRALILATIKIVKFPHFKFHFSMHLPLPLKAELVFP